VKEARRIREKDSTATTSESNSSTMDVHLYLNSTASFRECRTPSEDTGRMESSLCLLQLFSKSVRPALSLCGCVLSTCLLTVELCEPEQRPRLDEKHYSAVSLLSTLDDRAKEQAILFRDVPKYDLYAYHQRRLNGGLPHRHARYQNQTKTEKAKEEEELKLRIKR